MTSTPEASAFVPLTVGRSKEMRNLLTSSAVPLSLLTAVKVSDAKKEISGGSNQEAIETPPVRG
ncbi:hypothetical protein [Streptomyces sp. NPDC127190]|uniref:hypothetical protein n=1 Tax=unclassified Streptomyces TaxID=2593676 RepID=UPI00362E2347